MKIPTRIAFSVLFCFIILSKSNFLAKAQNTRISVNVGVILDFDTWTAKMGLSCINMALADFYASNSHYKTRLLLSSRDSKSDVVEAAAAAIDLIKNVEVQAIIGPENSMQAKFIIDLGEKTQVPTVAFSATSPSLTSLRSPYFFQAAQSSSSQVKAISEFVQAYGWREVVPIYIDNEYGQGIIPFLIDALQEVDARVPYRSVIPPLASDDHIVEEIFKLMTIQTRVFIVHMPIDLGSRLFTKVKEIGMMSEGYVWIITSGMADSIRSIESLARDSMQGVLGVKTYVPKTIELANFTLRWKKKFHQDNPNILDVELNVRGLWAYDAASALARAVEKAGTTNFGFENTTASSNLTDLATMGVSLNGPKLHQALLDTRFTGLAGEFNLQNGQLQSSTLQIINVNGNGERGVAFWTPENGLVRELNSTNTSMYSTSRRNLGPVIWPGDSSSIPKGWEIPTNGKKLRVGVPVKAGFFEFVQVEHDASTNTTNVKGYSIDIFEAVMKALPYNVDYEFIPFAKPNGESAGTYNDMVYQVYLGKFDAVAGDTTIIANRTNYIDFTLPYTESGVTMVVPIKDNERKNAWVFLKPLTWDLWITSGLFFVFIGFVVWVLEHRVNEEFRGPPSHEIGTSLWYSFSTMVFAQKMKFDSSKLGTYKSAEECDDLFSKGSANGGIAAAFDDIPCMKSLLSQYCSKYTMVHSIYKTDGFGFVFPKGSPFVSDVSWAVLNVIEGEQMKEIEKKWLGDQSDCPSSSTQVSSGSLSLESFWGLFLIAGIASLSALIISFSVFLYKERQQIWIRFDSKNSIWRRICHALTIFDNKDLSSHTFRNKALKDRDDIDYVDGIGASDASPSTNCPTSPISCSVHTEPEFTFSEDLGTPSREYFVPNPHGH
nr:glutamate receptor 2.2 [Quercus suber]